MARNSSGVYTLPIAAYVSGTVIKSADMNSNLNDISTALTQSIASTGVTVMTAPLPIAVGTVSTPGLAFVGSLSTGLYSALAGQFSATAGGTSVMTWATSLITAGALITTATGVTFTSGAVFTLSSGASATFSAGSTVTFTNTSWTFSSSSVANAFLTALAQQFTLVFTIEGGGSVPTTGDKGYIEAPCSGTILRATIMADQSGSAVVDIKKSTYAGFPPSSSICAAAKPTLSSAQKNQDSTLTGWTTTFTSGDIFDFNLNSVTTCTRIQVSLLYKRTSQ